MNAGLRDLYKALEGTADIQIKVFHKDKIQIEDLIVSANGDLKQASFASHIKGIYGEAFDLKTQGNFSSSETVEKVQLDLLQGQYADYPLDLIKRMVIHRSGNKYRLENADFNLAEGTLHAAGYFSPESLSGEVLFKGISLDILHLLGYSNLIGSASGHMKINGTSKKPEASLELSIMDAQLVYVSMKDSNLFTPARINARGEIKFLSEAEALILNGKGCFKLWGMLKSLRLQECYRSFVVISFFLIKDSL